MIYDTTLDITWLADMNYARTSGFDADGLMNWTAANNWANDLAYGGFTDWRLPTVAQPDLSCNGNFIPGGGFGQQPYGYNCTGGELGHLVYTDLGGNEGESVLNQTGDTLLEMANLALFSNLQSYLYWSGTDYAPNPRNVWTFRTADGLQDIYGKNLEFYALAVRPGGVVAVPEPQTLALALLALGAMVLARRRRPA